VRIIVHEGYHRRCSGGAATNVALWGCARCVMWPPGRVA
jgi:hypothetical protein